MTVAVGSEDRSVLVDRPDAGAEELQRPPRLASSLAARMAVNVVLHRRLWPRSLTGDLEPADREA